MKLPFTEYHQFNLCVTPVLTSSGAPVVKDWSDWSNEPQEEALLEKFEKEYQLPHYGIGLVCGEESGIVALDIDSESKDILSICPDSPVKKRGSKGETRFFKWNKEISSTFAHRDNIGPNRDKEDREGVDILAAGRQTIMPPSINRKTNQPYVWLTEHILPGYAANDLPELTAMDVEKIKFYINSFEKKPRTSGVGDRNNSINRATLAIVNSNPGHSIDELAELILAYDVNRHGSKSYFHDKTEPENKKAKGDAFLAAKIWTARHKEKIESKPELRATTVVGGAFTWQGLGLTIGKGNVPENNLENMVRILSGHKRFKNRFWLDTFKAKVMTDYDGEPRPMTDVDALEIQRFVQSDVGIRQMKKESVTSAISLVTDKDRRNELQDWIRQLPEWDGVPRVEHFFTKYYGADDSPYTTAVSKNFLISMIARGMSPGCKVDNMIILEGKQGIYKSSSLKALAGIDWFGELTAAIDKPLEFALQVQGRWILEVPELDVMVNAKVEASTLKRVLSSQTDDVRLLYQSSVTKFPRPGVFAGTTNAGGYLKDPTGGRRFWPIRCNRILLDEIAADRIKLFSEAKYYFVNGVEWHDVPQDEAAAEVLDRTETDPWEDEIRSALSDPTRLKDVDLTNKCIFDAILKIEPRYQTNSLSKRVRTIMESIGYKFVKSNGVRKYVFK